MTVRSNGLASSWTLLADPGAPQSSYPLVDSRQQLKDNLRFLLREADYYPFSFDQQGNYYGSFAWPANYIYSGFYGDGGAGVDFTQFAPIEANYIYRNFVFDSTRLKSDGFLNTGVYPYPDQSSDALILTSTPSFYFDVPAFLTNHLAISSSLLTMNQTRWLMSDDPQVTSFNGEAFISGFANCYGLTNLSAECAYVDTNGNHFTATIYPNDYFPTNATGLLYFEYEQPQFVNNGYYFARPSLDELPESSSFSTTNTTPLIVQGVGTSQQIAGFAQLGILNGYSDTYAYLGQYFQQAYQIDTNGNVTANPTGILSPYGNFYATQPGPAALVTMPDIDPPYQQGTCTVYCVSLDLDKNHDGTMDLSFNGTDATSPNSPYIFWANNNFDRWAYDSDDKTNYMDDVQIQGCPATPNTPTPDCNYSNVLVNGYAYRAIPCTRDLQDFFRLWVCGINSNLLAALPTNSTITLNWGDVGSPNSANPTIDLFTAADPDGGIGYLTNETVATTQINAISCPYIGRLAPGGSIQLNASQFNGWAGNHFIMCGVSNGTGGLNLTIKDGNGNVLGQATSYLQIVDIKQMYERWSVGDNPNNAPTNTAYIVSDGLTAGEMPFRYSNPATAGTPYIMFVHGWNMQYWEKDRFAESAFKRLYWQGYQGRFGSFRWPTGFGFTGWQTIATNLTEKDNFDSSEYQAWQSAQGLLNKLNDLNGQYPGHVYLLAHSMGNVVANEALRLSGSSQVVNTYVASQAAVSAHTYDTNVANYSFYYPPWSLSADTPNIYGNWFSGNNGGGAGQVVSFYNVNDFALQRSVWQRDELLKPDQDVLEGTTTWYYGYSGSVSDPAPWNNFYKQTFNGSTVFYFNIVTSLNNRHEVMGYAAQSYTTALGATAGVHHLADSIDLTGVWPPDPTGNNYTEHFYHSAEFRGDNPQQRNYWSELLGSDAFNLK